MPVVQGGQQQARGQDRQARCEEGQAGGEGSGSCPGKQERADARRQHHAEEPGLALGFQKAEGKAQIKKTIDYYMTNAKIMKEGLEATGLKVYGGVNAPYLWVKTPNGLSSWRFFEQMLYEANVVGTPGVGFGPSGEGYIRLTAFGERNDCIEAMRSIKNWL